MSTAHEDLAAFQQFAPQKVNAGEADSLEELFDLHRGNSVKVAGVD